MRVEQGQHTLVVGSRARRAALATVLMTSGARQLLAGRVRAPRAHRNVVHVSTGRPYMRAGSSLWDLLVFPHDKAQSQRRGVEERQLGQLLRYLGFGFLLEHVEDDWARVVDWAKVLDRSELAALALCRVLYHAPQFALVDDDALASLRPDHVAQVFSAANMHHVTLLVLADVDPFDDSLASPPPSAHAPKAPAQGFITSIGEFSRALRLHPDGWDFCSFGYGKRPAFDPLGARRWVWATAADKQARLVRRTSTISQCSTTERRWLVSPECPMSPTTHDPRAGSSLSRRHSSRVVSPVLTPRSSVSDFASGVDGNSVRARLQTINGALKGFARKSISPVMKEASASEVDSEPSSGGHVGGLRAAAVLSDNESSERSQSMASDRSSLHQLTSSQDMTLGTVRQSLSPQEVSLNAAAYQSSSPQDMSLGAALQSSSTAAPQSLTSSSPPSQASYSRGSRPRNYRRSTRGSAGVSAMSFVPPGSPTPRPRRYSASISPNPEPASDGLAAVAEEEPSQSENKSRIPRLVPKSLSRRSSSRSTRRYAASPTAASRQGLPTPIDELTAALEKL
ncbi:ATP-binding cassette sub- D member 1 [Coemansia sp. RSA 552]|nr:ATP-binding cassette sub- D member 1 [Coemansia sp. RSA 552]